MPRTVVALILREMATTYGRSAGGYVWAILEPVLGVALLSVVFGMALAHPGLGTNFPLFYATGFLPFTMFNDVTNKVATSIRFSRPFLAYPSVTFVDAILGRFVLNGITQILVATVIFTGILLVFDTKTIVQMPYVAAALAMAAALALGIGTLNCFLFTKFPIWQQLWSILTRPLFLVSCVFMLFDQIPTWARDWLWYNPIIHCVGMMRHGFYSTYHASYVSVAYVLAVALVTGTIGLMLLYRHKDDLLER